MSPIECYNRSRAPRNYVEFIQDLTVASDKNSPNHARLGLNSADKNEKKIDKERQSIRNGEGTLTVSLLVRQDGGDSIQNTIMRELMKRSLKRRVLY